MPRISRCDKLPEHERLRLVGAIGDGRTWDQLASDFGIPAMSIREWSVRNGYQRNLIAAKRKLVDDLLSKPETVEKIVSATDSTGNHEVDAAAREDERDMRLGLNAARLALQVSAMGLQSMKDGDIQDPKATKIWSECVSINVNTIRTIRSLNKDSNAAIVLGHNMRVVNES
ncbi:hypothetical protein CCP4SC76_2160005 [Gammaproteobacteria bacterium]